MIYEGEALKAVYGDYDELCDGTKLVCGDLCLELDYIVKDGQRTYVVALSECETQAHELEERPLMMTRLFAARMNNYRLANGVLAYFVECYHDDEMTRDMVIANIRCTLEGWSH